VRHLRAAGADQAGSQRARWLVADAQASQVIDVVEHVATASDLETLLRQGRIAVGIFIPPDFDARVSDTSRPAAQLLLDGSDPIVIQAARGLLELPLREPGRGAPSATASAARSFELRPYYNPERRSAVQIVPGLIGVILTMTMTLFTAVAIVRERERGNLELLITTPVRTPELMLGKIIPYMAIGLIQVTLILVIGSLLFRVPVRGTLQDVYALSFVFVIATLALGLLISTLVQTQFQAFQLTFFTFLPQILLSGFMFPFDGMPRPAQLLAEIFPLTHFVRIIRGILLRGASTLDVFPDVWPLLVFFAVTMGLAVLRFRKRLD
jgi:ABC-2 type transport system permease protein